MHFFIAHLSNGYVIANSYLILAQFLWLFDWQSAGIYPVKSISFRFFIFRPTILDDLSVLEDK